MKNELVWTIWWRVDSEENNETTVSNAKSKIVKMTGEWLFQKLKIYIQNYRLTGDSCFIAINIVTYSQPLTLK